MPYSKGIEQFVKECWHLTQNGIKRENYLCPICSISTAHILWQEIRKKLIFSMKNFEIRYDEGRKKESREKG